MGQHELLNIWFPITKQAKPKICHFTTIVLIFFYRTVIITCTHTHIHAHSQCGWSIENSNTYVTVKKNSNRLMPMPIKPANLYLCLCEYDEINRHSWRHLWTKSNEAIDVQHTLFYICLYILFMQERGREREKKNESNT